LTGVEEGGLGGQARKTGGLEPPDFVEGTKAGGKAKSLARARGRANKGKKRLVFSRGGGLRVYCRVDGGTRKVINLPLRNSSRQENNKLKERRLKRKKGGKYREKLEGSGQEEKKQKDHLKKKKNLRVHGGTVSREGPTT